MRSVSYQRKVGDLFFPEHLGSFFYSMFFFCFLPLTSISPFSTSSSFVPFVSSSPPPIVHSSPLHPTPFLSSVPQCPDKCKCVRSLANFAFAEMRSSDNDRCDKLCILSESVLTFASTATRVRPECTPLQHQQTQVDERTWTLHV
jgi:hypothetical protein